MKFGILRQLAFDAVFLTFTLSGCGGGSDLPNPQSLGRNSCDTDTCICDDGTELERKLSLQCDFPECPDNSACELIVE